MMMLMMGRSRELVFVRNHMCTSRRWLTQGDVIRSVDATYIHRRVSNTHNGYAGVDTGLWTKGETVGVGKRAIGGKRR